MAGNRPTTHPRDGSNGNLDPDHDGWDVDGDGGGIIQLLIQQQLLLALMLSKMLGWRPILL